jgi:small subunit ribosomal protein S21
MPVRHRPSLELRASCYIDGLDNLACCMTQVTVGENEGIESALRRFKRQVSKAGIFADLKRLRHHETPIEKYKRKAQQRRRRR